MKKILLTTILLLAILTPVASGMGFGQSFQARILVEPGLESDVFTYRIIPTADQTLEYTLEVKGYLSEYIA